MAFHDKHNARDWKSWLQNHLVWFVDPCEKVDDYLIDEEPFELTEEQRELLFERTEKFDD